MRKIVVVFALLMALAIPAIAEAATICLPKAMYGYPACKVERPWLGRVW